MNNLETKVQDLDVGKLKSVNVEWKKKKSDVPDNEVVKDTKSNTLKSIQHKIWEKKLEMLIKSTTYKCFSNCSCCLE